MSIYTRNYNNKSTAQTEFVPGVKSQVRNSAGGVSFAVSPMDRLDRFLILGSESPTYYASAAKATRDNAKSIEKLIASEGVNVVNRVVQISKEGRAPKNDPAVFVLAMCAKLGDDVTRKAAYEALPEVCRIGTHLFQFAEAAEAFGGWGRGMRNAVANWYNSKKTEALQYQAIKYKQRNGWSHRDLLRLAHVKPTDEMHGEIYKWVTKGQSDSVDFGESDSDLWIIWAAEQLKTCTKASEVVNLITDYNLPREVIPTEWLNDKKVWEALLVNMPLTAMIRNLGKMSSVGILGPLSNGEAQVEAMLQNKAALEKARIHPLNVLNALNVYNNGRGVKGNLTWKVSQRVCTALDEAFYTSFKYVEPTGKRTLLALDVSGSMGMNLSSMPGLTARTGSAAMAMVTAAVEKNHHVMGFCHSFVPLNISPKKSLTTIVGEIDRLHFGSTDCSLPMQWAQKNKVPVDTFVVYTDSETYAGRPHPFQAIKEYRQAMGIPAKLIVVGMVSNGFTIADPSDGGMLDVVGFDSATPAIISNFSKD